MGGSLLPSIDSVEVDSLHLPLFKILIFCLTIERVRKITAGFVSVGGRY